MKEYLLCTAEESVYKKMGLSYPHTSHEHRYKYTELEPSELERLVDSDVTRCNACYIANNAKCPLE